MKSKLENTEFSKSVGKRIKERREELKYSVKDLANYIGTTPNAVNHWESGRFLPALKNLKLICSALETNIGYIADGDLTKEPEPVAKTEEVMELEIGFIEKKGAERELTEAFLAHNFDISLLAAAIIRRQMRKLES